MSEVTSAIQSLNQTISQFESNVDVHVSDIRTASVNVEEATKSIYRKLQEFQENMEHGEQTQLAHENIIRIDQIMKEQFGSYETIRRTVMGVVRDFDINLVRNSTIQELSEELWMTNSRYWLSYALIAITAWVNNYPDVAKSALSECERKDAIKATLFFCLLNLRFERNEVAKKWFFEYLKTLDPTMLQQESAVMLQAFLDGIFGMDRELEQSVIDVIDQWITIINEDAQINEQLVTAYETYLANINPHRSFDYVNILQYCSNSAELSEAYMEVSKYDTILGLLGELNVENVEQNEENYKERVDSVLINLISNYDEEELELRSEQEYFNLVVRNEGVVETAQKQYEAEMELRNEHFNIGKQMINWAIYDETANARVRKFAFQNTKAWFKTALDHFAIRVQQLFPIEYHLAIDTWTGISNGSDQEEMTENMRSYYEVNKFQNMFVNTPNAAAAIVLIVSIVLAVAMHSLYPLVASILAVLFLGYRVYKAFNDYPKRVEAALSALQMTMAEISEFRQYYLENSKKKDMVLSETEFI